MMLLPFRMGYISSEFWRGGSSKATGKHDNNNSTVLISVPMEVPVPPKMTTTMIR